MARKRIRIEARREVKSSLPVAVLWSVFLFLLGAGAWNSFKPSNELPPMMLNDHLEIAQMRFGMREDAVRAMYRDAEEFPAGNASIIAFNSDGGRYHVWFSPDDMGGSLYRIRFEQAYEDDVTEEEILNVFGDVLGRPLNTGCERPSKLERQCGYQWWGGDGIRLDATVRTISSILGDQRLVVSFIAQDTLLEQRLERVQLMALR